MNKAVSGQKALHFDFLKSDVEVKNQHGNVKKIYSIRGVIDETRRRGTIDSDKKTQIKNKATSSALLPVITHQQSFHAESNNSKMKKPIQNKPISQSDSGNVELPKINKYIIKTDTSNLDESNWKKFFNKPGRKNKDSSIAKENENFLLDNKMASKELEQESDKEESNKEENNKEESDKEDQNTMLASSLLLSKDQKYLKPTNTNSKVKRKPRNLQKLYRFA